MGAYAYIVERDNLVGEAAKLKKLYRVALADLKPAALGGGTACREQGKRCATSFRTCSR